MEWSAMMQYLMRSVLNDFFRSVEGFCEKMKFLLSISWNLTETSREYRHIHGSDASYTD